MNLATFAGALYGAAAVMALLSSARADVVISSDPTQNMSCNAGVCMPTANEAVLNVADLENLLSSGDVSVVTTNGSVRADNIDVVSPFGWATESRLTLDAEQTVRFSAVGQVRGRGGVTIITSDGGSGELTFVVGEGALTFASFGTLSINGKKYRLIGSISELAAAIAAHPAGSFALRNDYDATPDGLYEVSPVSTSFRGAFNGLGHTISNLKIDDKSSFAGFFVSVETAGSLASVSLSHATVQAAQVGGILAAVNDGTISNSSVSGSVRSTINAGGLSGENWGTIVASRARASVHANYSGGMVGLNEGAVRLSFASRNSAGFQSGGLIGENVGTIENSYALGDVAGQGRGSYAGGLVGYNYLGSVQRSYSTGTVSGRKKSYIGGVEGVEAGAAMDCYWDTDTSGTLQGSGNDDETGLTGLTTQQLQSGLPTGFDPAIWGQAPGINNGYPYLLANPPQ